MCGITGIACRNMSFIDSACKRVKKSILRLKHRGPDSNGFCKRGRVLLGHTRLSIIDLTESGHQPMQSIDERFCVTFNGEIYNYREIRKELEAQNNSNKNLNPELFFQKATKKFYGTGEVDKKYEKKRYEWRGNSDTEVLLEAFAKWGPDCLNRLNGMFAFAIHDSFKKELWLVRDRLGIKPLYYVFSGNELCFSSEIISLLELLESKPRCDTQLLHEWFYYGNSLGGKTLFKGITQLPPGHFLRLQLEPWKVDIRSYWSLEKHITLPSPKERGKLLATAVRDRLASAVDRQLISDVPIGIFLSGGIDSSAIATFAAKSLGSKLQTFCAGFDDPAFPDERPRARWLANQLGTTHNDFLIRGEGMADTVEKLIDHHGGPFSDAANIPLWFMAKEVRSSIKVALQGDGGDELFGGYRRYQTLRWHRLLRLFAGLANPVIKRAPTSKMIQRIRRYCAAFDQSDISKTIGLLLTMEGTDPSLLNIFCEKTRKLIQSTDPINNYKKISKKFSDKDICRRMSLIDLSTVLPDIYLEKVDRATMAHGLEVRVPFLDNELVDYIVRLPGKITMPGGQNKKLLKAALSGTVPDKILRRPKTGFNVPFGRWLRSTLRQHFSDHLDEFRRLNPGIMHHKIVQTWIEHDAIGRVDLSSRLWKIYNLVIWANRFQVRFDE